MEDKAMTKLIKPIKDRFENHARAVSLGVLTADMFASEAIKVQVRADEITVERQKIEAESLKVFEKRKLKAKSNKIKTG